MLFLTYSFFLGEHPVYRRVQVTGLVDRGIVSLCEIIAVESRKKKRIDTCLIFTRPRRRENRNYERFGDGSEKRKENLLQSRFGLLRMPFSAMC